MAAYQLTTGGVIRASDGAFIPNDPTNGGWRDYEAWNAAGGTPDADPVPTLSTAKDLARAEVDRQAEVEFTAALPGAATRIVREQVYREADLADADGTITGGEYPLLEALVPLEGASVAAVATAMIAERATLVTALAAIESVRADAYSAIATAVTTSDVQDVLDGLTWP